jgi:hypothetical protein
MSYEAYEVYEAFGGWAWACELGIWRRAVGALRWLYLRAGAIP